MWNYHKVLATAKAVEIYRSGNYGGRIGCILNPEMVYARSNSPEDQKLLICMICFIIEYF